MSSIPIDATQLIILEHWLLHISTHTVFKTLQLLMNQSQSDEHILTILERFVFIPIAVNISNICRVRLGKIPDRRALLSGRKSALEMAMRNYADQAKPSISRAVSVDSLCSLPLECAPDQRSPEEEDGGECSSTSLLLPQAKMERNLLLATQNLKFRRPCKTSVLPTPWLGRYYLSVALLVVRMNYSPSPPAIDAS